jgi:hypothetical protein
MAYPYIPAKYQGAQRGNPTLIVIHDMESPEKGDTAENVARYFQNINRPASAHYCIDVDSIVQCVPDNRVAYHAPGANRVGIGLEHAGYASQTAADWTDSYSKAMLGNSIKLSADLCRKYGIRAQFLSAANLVAGNMNGITTHAEVSKAFHLSTHTDPGPNFPIEYYIFVLATTLNADRPPAPVSPAAPPIPPMPQPAPITPAPVDWAAIRRLAAALLIPPTGALPLLRRGMKGDNVLTLQKVMNFTTGGHMAEDGDYGPSAEQSVRDFQAWFHLTVDGIAGDQVRFILLVMLDKIKNGLA